MSESCAARRAGRRTCLSALSLALAIGVGGCERVMRDMYDQPKLKTNAATPLFADGQGSRLPPLGSVAATAGNLAADTAGRRGAQTLADLDAADRAPALPPTTDAARLERGRERYAIYCVPCHSAVGDGDGMVVHRGFPAPPSFAITRLRDAPDRHLYDVIGNGYGVMRPYADRVDAKDRWAIVAYVRHLQRDVLPADRAPAASVAASDSPGRPH